ncbi:MULTISPECIES: chemotaxis protein CheW [Thiomicrorhabdus]|uniref:Chemotaxis protein CheW n=1 Tax=Thiomicrorhabdus xiamenensis TaxID=2739063 RepID=A0A7D4T1F9_9GAMM|nr:MULTISPECIES: chemotaxis protein CheW [Thiomicrorhabdus]MBO1924556.1 purine-binding chemotaxis protein CheW [Thiomicrorhabdus sp. 6S3-12]QKI89525.1 purine-binding chemotaxis protein CheW [Thiomicrorhabdus xiamenensis]
MENAEKNLDDIQEQIDQSHSDDDQVLSFVLGNEEYGVDILRVQEIKGWEKTTDIPNTPDYVMGVINLRGAVVPIVDLRVRFGLDNITYNDSTVVVIVRAEDTNGSHKIIGMVVDGVSDVHSVSQQTLQAAPSMSGTINTEYVKGLATVGDKMVIILHIDQLINDGILSAIKKSLNIE